MSQRFEGRNLEEALSSAAETLGAERWQLTYHVLMEKRGFLGGVKRVVIEAEVNREASAPPPAAAPAPSAPFESRPAPPTSRPPRERGRGGRGRDSRRGGGGGGGERSSERGGRGRRGPRREHDEELQSGDFEQFFAEIPEQGPESENAAGVRGWIEQVLSQAKLDLQVRTEENDTQVIVRLYGPDSPRLTDRHGELLDALQVLANKSLGGRRIEKDIELDTQEFKGKRLEDLGQRARDLADRVRRDGREQLLPAMSPIERRIVHMALRDDAEVTTESRGEGFFKRVAIIMKPEGSEPATE